MTIATKRTVQILRELAAQVTDPELPMMTLEDLGVLRDVKVDSSGKVTVTITPTYSGCPAIATMRDDLLHTLRDNGFDDVAITVSLTPPWSSDWITERGREALTAHGISTPLTAPRHHGPIALTIVPPRRAINCPRCGSKQVEITSEFGSTACKAMYRCMACLEPFDHIKEV